MLSASEVLCGLGVHDERVLALLVVNPQTEPDLLAAYLGQYGDPRGVDALLEAFDRYNPDDHPEWMWASQTFMELEGAIQALGGELTPDRQA